MAVRRLATEQPAHFAFTPENHAWCEGQIAKYPPGRQASAVLPLLWRAQAQHGNWLPKPAIELVAKMLDMPEIRVLEVATFYSMFNLAPVGTNFIQLCGTTPCVLRGAHAIRAVLERRIGAPLQVTPDGQFSWLEVECLGACCNAPMVQINNDYYEDLSPETMNQIMDDLAAGRTVQRGSQTGRVSSEFAPGKATTLRDPTLYDGSIIGAWRARFEDVGTPAASAPVAPPASPKSSPSSLAVVPAGQPTTQVAPSAAIIAPVLTPVSHPPPEPPPADMRTSAVAGGSPAASIVAAPAVAQTNLPAAAKAVSDADTKSPTQPPAAPTPDLAAAPSSPSPAPGAETAGTAATGAPPPVAHQMPASKPTAALPRQTAKATPSLAPQAAAVASDPDSGASEAPAVRAVEAAGEERLSAAAMAAREDAEIKAKLAGVSKNATAEERAHAVGTRPVGLAEARSGSADDLKRIKGIGKVNEGKLNAFGIFHFDQVAAWTRQEIRWVGTYLSFPGRIDREDWVGQAKLLAAGDATESSPRVAHSDVPTSADAPLRPKKGED